MRNRDYLNQQQQQQERQQGVANTEKGVEKEVCEMKNWFIGLVLF
jgi:hypothetical protein